MARSVTLVSVLLVIAFAAPRAWSGEKKPVPSPEALKAADERIAKDLKDAFAGPSKDLLEALLKYAEEHDKEPAVQFAALNMCLQRGISFGSSQYANRAGRAMTNAFDGIECGIFMGLLLEAEKGAPQQISYAALWELYGTLAYQAESCDDLQTARAALEKLKGLMGKDKAYSATEASIPYRIAHVEEMLAESNRVAEFRDRLKKNPKDKEANSRMGQYYLIVAQNENMAYPFFVKAKESKWLALCEMDSIIDLKKMTLNAHRVIKADALWDLAEETPHYATRMRQQAASLYQSSLSWGGRPPEPDYPREHVEKRMLELKRLGLDSYGQKIKEVKRKGGAPDGGISDLTEQALPAAPQTPEFPWEIRAYIKTHVDQYSTLKSRLELCNQMRAAGFTGDWIDRLKTELTAEFGNGK